MADTPVRTLRRQLDEESSSTRRLAHPRNLRAVVDPVRFRELCVPFWQSLAQALGEDVWRLNECYGGEVWSVDRRSNMLRVRANTELEAERYMALVLKLDRKGCCVHAHAVSAESTEQVVLPAAPLTLTAQGIHAADTLETASSIARRVFLDFLEQLDPNHNGPLRSTSTRHRLKRFS